MGSSLEIASADIVEHGSGSHRITDLPWMPREIPGLIKRQLRQSVAWIRSGPGTAPSNVVAGCAVRVQTDVGALVIRLAREASAVRLVGRVERLYAQRPVEHFHGIRLGDRVIVPSMDYVFVVDTHRR